MVLDKRQGTTLGIDADCSDGQTLLIEDVRDSGLFGEWNMKALPKRTVRPGDRIFEVNGVQGDIAELYEACRRNKLLIMKVRRLVPVRTA